MNLYLKTNTALKKGEPVKASENFPGVVERLDFKDKIIQGKDDWEMIQEKLSRIIGYSAGDYRAGDIADIIIK